MHPKQIDAVLAMGSADLYRYYVKAFVDSEELWSLRNDEGWVMAGDDDGVEYVPVWPHPKFAEMCAEESWAGTFVASIPLESWVSKWLPGIAADGRKVTVCPRPGQRGITIEPSAMSEDLEALEQEWYG